jgi:CRP-like cAMP-binding protein
MSAGEQSRILEVSDIFEAILADIGKKKHLIASETLFREDGDNAGVFLVLKGKVCLTMSSMPRPDRLFGSGWLLGLPSSFAGRPYSLTATAVTGADVVQVAQGDFLRLMRDRPELCREATEMLGREMTFIQSALAERLRQTASARTRSGDVVVT